MHMPEAMAALRQDIERWKAQLAHVDPDSEVVGRKTAEALLAWIAEGEKLVAASGY